MSLPYTDGRDAGFVPAQRDNRYEVLKTHDGSDAPDQQVTDWSTQRVVSLHQQSGLFSDVGGDDALQHASVVSIPATGPSV